MHAIPRRVFTVGHSTHTIEVFTGLLVRHAVALVVDVRSTPYSKWTPQFNREALAKSLADLGVRYGFFGDRLGARSPDPRAYEAGRVDYERLARTTAFQAGLHELSTRLEEGPIALLCAESDPMRCHRAILVGRELKAIGVDVEHILPDGTLLSQIDCESRLLATHRLVNQDLFAGESELLAQAYRLQAGRIAYVRDGAPDGEVEREEEDR